MYQFVIFDLDGTLLDTIEDLAHAGNYTLRALGFPTHPTESYKKMVGNGIPKLVFRMLPSHNNGQNVVSIALKIFEKYYGEHHNLFTQPYSGILDLLKSLRGLNIVTGVVSNKKNDFVQQLVYHHFQDLISLSTGLEENVPAKPNPQSLLALMASLEANPLTTLYVGDSDVDMITANRAGVHSCGVLWGFRGQQELAEAGASYIVDHVDDLKSIITKEKSIC